MVRKAGIERERDPDAHRYHPASPREEEEVLQPLPSLSFSTFRAAETDDDVCCSSKSSDLGGRELNSFLDPYCQMRFSKDDDKARYSVVQLPCRSRPEDFAGSMYGRLNTLLHHLR